MSLLSNKLNLVKSIVLSKNILQLSNTCERVARCRFMSTKPKSATSLKGMFKIGVVGITVGAVIGTGYSIHQLNHPRTHIMNEEVILKPVENIPNVVPSKSVSQN